MASNSQHYVYILRCKDQTLYTGYTTNVAKRLKKHMEGKGAKYTRGRAPFTLVYKQKCQTKSEAMQLEAQIKKLPKQRKLALIHEANQKIGEEDEDSKKLFKAIR